MVTKIGIGIPYSWLFLRDATFTVSSMYHEPVIFTDVLQRTSQQTSNYSFSISMQVLNDNV